jgi:hypothetical protein
MVCPVCTIAVAAGVGILDKLGVDRIIIGLWFGALILSSVLWMINWMNRRNYNFLFKKLIITVGFYIIFIIPLYFLKQGGTFIMGGSMGNILGIDRLFFGTILGSFIFIAAVASNEYLKKLNENKVLVNYQKIFIPVVFLIITSIIINLIIKLVQIG